MRTRIHSFLGLLTLAALGSLAGCASIEDCKYETGQKLRAWHAFEEYKHTCGSPLSIDYACGWKSGYYDVATGGNGCPPLTAPQRYWKPSQILARCDQDRKQWYIGFQDGAAYASRMPDTHYLKLWMPPCQPCGCRADGCPTGSCHPPVCEHREGIIDSGAGYPIGPVPADEIAPEAGPALSPEHEPPPSPGEPNPDDLPPEEDAPVAPAAMNSPASDTPRAVDRSSVNGFRIIGPLDVNLTDTRPAPFIKQSGSQITLVSGIETSDSKQSVLGAKE